MANRNENNFVSGHKRRFALVCDAFVAFMWRKIWDLCSPTLPHRRRCTDCTLTNTHITTFGARCCQT